LARHLGGPTGFTATLGLDIDTHRFQAFFHFFMTPMEISMKKTARHTVTKLLKPLASLKPGLLVLSIAVQAGLPAYATPLSSLISAKGSMAVGDLVFDGFAIGVSPLLSPQGATVGGGGSDIDVSTTTNASGQPVLRLTQINSTTHAPQPLLVDLTTKGNKDQLRNVTFKVTVKNPAMKLISVAQSVGPGTKAMGEVTGSVFSYAMVPQPAPGVPLPGQISFLNFSQVSQIGANSPTLPNGAVSSQIVDTAWLITTAHARGKSPVGSASIDSIDLAFSIGAP
jgi:hypothetical protein